MAPHAKEVFPVLLRGLERRGYAAVRAERLRGHFRKRAEKAPRLLRARLTGSGQILRAARRRRTLAGCGERPHPRRSVPPARSKSAICAARLIARESTQCVISTTFPLLLSGESPKF